MIILLAGGWAVHLLAQAVAYAIPWIIPHVGLPAIMAETLLAWLTITLSGRRLHDMGRSSWWQIPLFAVMIALLAAAEPAWAEALGLNEYLAEAAMLAALAIYVAFLVILGLIRGNAGPNRFGPAPA